VKRTTSLEEDYIRRLFRGIHQVNCTDVPFEANQKTFFGILLKQNNPQTAAIN